MHCFEPYSSPKLSLFPAENKDTVLQPVLPFSLKKKITTSRQCKNENWVGWSVSFTFYFVLTFCYSSPWIKRGHFYHLSFSSPLWGGFLSCDTGGHVAPFPPFWCCFWTLLLNPSTIITGAALDAPFHCCAGSAPCDSITDWKILAEWGRGQ